MLCCFYFFGRQWHLVVNFLWVLRLLGRFLALTFKDDFQTATPQGRVPKVQALSIRRIVCQTTKEKDLVTSFLSPLQAQTNYNSQGQNIKIIYGSQNPKHFLIEQQVPTGNAQPKESPLVLWWKGPHIGHYWTKSPKKHRKSNPNTNITSNRPKSLQNRHP